MSEEKMPTGAIGQSRRALLAGAGAVGASVVLAACGGSDEDGDQGNPPVSGGPGGSATGDAGGDRSGSNSLATTADIPEGGGKVLASDGVVITQPRPGEFKGFSSLCTHQNCPVSSVTGGTINCTCHGSKFSIEDGSVKVGPATRPLPEKALKVEGDRISLA